MYVPCYFFMNFCDLNIDLTHFFYKNCRSFNELSKTVCPSRYDSRFRDLTGGRKGPRPIQSLSEPARNGVKSVSNRYRIQRYISPNMCVIYVIFTHDLIHTCLAVRILVAIQLSRITCVIRAVLGSRWTMPVKEYTAHLVRSSSFSRRGHICSFGKYLHICFLYSSQLSIKWAMCNVMLNLLLRDAFFCICAFLHMRIKCAYD